MAQHTRSREEFVMEVVLRTVVVHLGNRSVDVSTAKEELKKLVPAWRQLAEAAADEFFPRGAYGPQG